MAFYVYILKCSNGKYYTGHTDELERRIAQHQCGDIKGYTSEHLPVILVWAQDFPSRYEALDAEMKIKGWSQAKKEALIKGDWGSVSFFAKPPKKRLGAPHGVSTGLDKNGDDGPIFAKYNSEDGAFNTNRGESDAPSHPFVSSPVETPIGRKPTISTKPTHQ